MNEGRRLEEKRKRRRGRKKEKKRERSQRRLVGNCTIPLEKRKERGRWMGRNDSSWERAFIAERAFHDRKEQKGGI
jgi:hypothetical protein